ncbi:MAG: hypothetical protein PHF79_00745 [Candidatus Pacebacteria bacterium]|nr:hypothetical protein [Candidatus Paceibacterota bacterium]
MSNLIVRSGYFEVEGGVQGLMARIVSSDGTKTGWLVTKRQALETGEALIGIGITDLEWLAIKEQVHASSLISHDAELEEFATKSQIALDELKRRVEALVKSLKKDEDEGGWWK